MIEPDVDTIEERLYELYADWCENNGLNPSIKGYTIWLQERYN